MDDVSGDGSADIKLGAKFGDGGLGFVRFLNGGGLPYWQIAKKLMRTALSASRADVSTHPRLTRSLAMISTHDHKPITTGYNGVKGQDLPPWPIFAQSLA